MKTRVLSISALLLMGMGSGQMNAQRYLEEIFTESQLEITPNVVYAQNIDFLLSNFAGANTAMDIFILSQLADNGTPFPAAFFDPADASTDVKLRNLRMDIYRPSAEFDDVTDRPVMLHLHTGNFLPPVINGSVHGSKNDSIAIHLCKEWAKRGYVAISMEYRLGWNPLAATVQERRGQLLNAVYRAIHDLKWAVRYLRQSAESEGNPYGINPNKIVAFGNGSGGYVTQAAATLDKGEEMFIEKFLPNPFDPTTSYIDTLLVGNINGIGFPLSLNLYRDNGVSAEFHVSVNLGGALADESWLEAGDVPMLAMNCVRDDFAPFNEGVVIVPTTQEEVVDVHGVNVFIQKANDLGNNDIFAGIPDGDPFTDRARSLYGTSWSVSNGGTVVISDTPEGLFPVIRPEYPFLFSDSSPWQWWDPASPLANQVTANGFTAHQNSLASNPFMSVEQGHAYCDTINGYMLPRIMCALYLPENPCGSVEPPVNNLCSGAIDINEFIMTDLSIVVTDPYFNSGASSQGDPANGWACFLDNGGAALDNTIWFRFTGNGRTYNIRTNNCNNTLGDDYIINGDTQMAIYSGSSCGNLVSIACNDNGPGSSSSNNFAEIQFATVAGVQYWMMIDGANAAQGGFCLRLEDLGVSISELEANSVAVFPNPFSQSLRIEANENIQAINIYSLTGHLVKQVKGQTGPAVVVDTNELAQGVYMMMIQLPSGPVSKRIVKQ
jgi:acetyl esterase/lipase